ARNGRHADPPGGWPPHGAVHSRRGVSRDRRLGTRHAAGCNPRGAGIYPAVCREGGIKQNGCEAGGRIDQAYLILPSLNTTCLRSTGSYFLTVNFSVIVRVFFLAT